MYPVYLIARGAAIDQIDGEDLTIACASGTIRCEVELVDVERWGFVMRSERHWSVYLPALSISILWAGVLFWADGREPPLEALKLLALAVEIIAVPVLYFRAFFRARGAEVTVTATGLAISPGGRAAERVEVDWASVGNVQMARSHLQKMVGAGQIRIDLTDGRQFVLDDMSAPDRLVEVIRLERVGKDKEKENTK